jgi:hypothetical protein
MKRQLLIVSSALFLCVAAGGYRSFAANGDETLPIGYAKFTKVDVPPKVYTDTEAPKHWSEMYQSEWVTCSAAGRGPGLVVPDGHPFFEWHADGGVTKCRVGIRVKNDGFTKYSVFGEIVQDGHPVVTTDLDPTESPLPYSRALIFKVDPDKSGNLVASIVFHNWDTGHPRRVRIDLLAKR